MAIFSPATPEARSRGAALLVPGVTFAVWYAVTRAGLVSPLLLPSPFAVLATAWRLSVTAGVAVDVAATIGRVAFALLIGLVVGVPAGLAFGYWPAAYNWCDKPLHALRSVPATALFPLLLIVVGVGEGAILWLAAYPSVLLVLVNTVTGVQLANQRRLGHARALGLSAPAMLGEVLLYEALPAIFQGVRTAVSFVLALVIAAEMFIGISHRGLGRLIYDYQTTYRIPETYAVILIAGACGILLNGVVTVAERRILRWRPNLAAPSV